MGPRNVEYDKMLKGELVKVALKAKLPRGGTKVQLLKRIKAWAKSQGQDPPASPADKEKEAPVDKPKAPGPKEVAFVDEDVRAPLPTPPKDAVFDGSDRSKYREWRRVISAWLRVRCKWYSDTTLGAELFATLSGIARTHVSSKIEEGSETASAILIVLDRKFIDPLTIQLVAACDDFSALKRGRESLGEYLSTWEAKRGEAERRGRVSDDRMDAVHLLGTAGLTEGEYKDAVLEAEKSGGLGVDGVLKHLETFAFVSDLRVGGSRADKSGGGGESKASLSRKEKSLLAAWRGEPGKGQGKGKKGNGKGGGGAPGVQQFINKQKTARWGGGGGGGKGGGGAGNNRGQAGGGGNTANVPCRFFPKGTCNRGAACPYKHDTAPGGGGGRGGGASAWTGSASGGGAAAGGQAPALMAFKPGDWHCPGCKDHQFASNTHCRMCKTPRPANAGPKGKGKGAGQAPAIVP